MNDGGMIGPSETGSMMQSSFRVVAFHGGKGGLNKTMDIAHGNMPGRTAASFP